jgi:hypothetical protein
MVKKIVSLVLISLLGIFVFAQESNIDLANRYYNQDNYEEAYKYYLDAIKENKPDAVSFYRFAYSCEQLKKKKNYYNEYYKGAAYLFEKNNDLNNKYYGYVINKEKENGLNHADFNDESIQNLVNNIEYKEKGLSYITSKLLDFASNNLAVFAIVALVIWILGIIFSKATKCVIVYGWKDIIILLIPGAIFSFYLFFSDSITHEIILNIIFFISFAISIVFSFIGNIKSTNHFNIFYILISIIVKVLLVILIPIVIVAFIGALGSGKKDGRYRDGTKGNTKTAMIGLVIGLVGLLLLPLIKTEDEIVTISEENMNNLA